LGTITGINKKAGMKEGMNGGDLVAKYATMRQCGYMQLVFQQKLILRTTLGGSFPGSSPSVTRLEFTLVYAKRDI
jgi:hypothetical protein